jgi:hypothetical protein
MKKNLNEEVSRIKLMMGKIMTESFEDVKEQEKTPSNFVSCSGLGVKSPGLCDKKTKKPVVSCAKLGVKSIGYCFVDTKQPVQLSEGKLSLMINESMAQAAIADAESKISGGEKPDPNVVNKIKQCITKNQLTRLGFLTTSSGAYALGIIAMLMSNPVGFAVGGVLALTSIIVMFITGLPEDQGGLGADPAKDVKALLSCVGI